MLPLDYILIIALVGLAGVVVAVIMANVCNSVLFTRKGISAADKAKFKKAREATKQREAITTDNKLNARDHYTN